MVSRRAVGPDRIGNLEERARHRGGMGRSSGGNFDAGVASAYSSSGRAEPFAPDVCDQPRRRTMDDPPSYYDSYWDRSYPNNQRSWSTEQDQRRRGMQAGYGFFAVFAFFALFLSMWMLFGLYGNQQLEMGMFYSRVIKANPFFVKEIKVQNLRDKGPVAYSFSTWPELSSPVSDKRTFEDIVVERRSHQRNIYWLNKGSSIELSCTLKGSEAGTDSLIVAIVKGEDGFQDWKGDPGNPSSALRWKRINDKGSLSLKVEEDDDYCIVFGNLNNRKLTFSVNLDFRYALYSSKDADLVCSSQIDDTCEFPVPLGQSTYVLLTSPVVNEYLDAKLFDAQNHIIWIVKLKLLPYTISLYLWLLKHVEFGVDVWKTQLSYVPRWIIYISFWGLVAAGALFTKAFELRQASAGAFTPQEHAPLVGEDTAQTPSAPVDPSMQADETDNERAVPENALCTICLDAPKDSFFDPCGHRYTCYSCGLRIQRGDTNRCPICRQTIRTVRRIYDA